MTSYGAAFQDGIDGIPRFQEMHTSRRQLQAESAGIVWSVHALLTDSMVSDDTLLGP